MLAEDARIHGGPDPDRARLREALRMLRIEMGLPAFLELEFEWQGSEWGTLLAEAAVPSANPQSPVAKDVAPDLAAELAARGVPIRPSSP